MYSVRYIHNHRRAGLAFGSLNGCAPKFHLTPTIEIDLFLGLTVTFHWLGIKVWLMPWHNKAEEDRLHGRAEASIAARQAATDKGAQ